MRVEYAQRELSSNQSLLIELLVLDRYRDTDTLGRFLVKIQNKTHHYATISSPVSFYRWTPVSKKVGITFLQFFKT